MSRATRLTALATLLVIAACSGDKQTAAPDVSEAPESSVFDPMTDAIDRARGVEQQVDQRADELSKRLEEAEGN